MSASIHSRILAGMAMPTAADPYPLMAAGWGPERARA